MNIVTLHDEKEYFSWKLARRFEAIASPVALWFTSFSFIISLFFEEDFFTRQPNQNSLRPVCRAAI